MKIPVVLAALMLPCFLAFSQEADNSGRSVGLSLIPRLDLNPQIPVGDRGDSDFTLGNSSFYTLFEGNLSPKFSFSLCNHWLSDDPGSLYRNSLRSDDMTWTDWAYLTYSPGAGFDISAGKMMISVGGVEYDDYDYDVHTGLASSLWNNLACYQWGGKVSWTTPSEGHTFGLQMVTSPYGEHPFKSGLYSYSFDWRGNIGFLETIWSASAMGTGEGNFDYLVCLGNRLDFDPVTVGLDYFSRAGDEENILSGGGTYMIDVRWASSIKMDVIAKGGYEHSQNMDRWFYGAGVQWYPLDSGRDLKFHTVASYDSFTGLFSLNMGMTWYIGIL